MRESTRLNHAGQVALVCPSTPRGSGKSREPASPAAVGLKQSPTHGKSSSSSTSAVDVTCKILQDRLMSESHRSAEADRELQREQAELERLRIELQVILDKRPSFVAQHTSEMTTLREEAKILTEEIMNMKQAKIRKSQENELAKAQHAELQREVAARRKAVEIKEKELQDTEQDIERERKAWEKKHAADQLQLNVLRGKIGSHIKARSSLEQEHHATLECWEAEKEAVARDLAEKQFAASRQAHGNLQQLARLKETASEDSKKWKIERQQLREAIESCSASNYSLRCEVERMEADKDALIKSMSRSALAKAQQNHGMYLRDLQSGWFEVHDRFESVVAHLQGSLYHIQEEKEKIKHELRGEELKESHEKAALEENLDCRRFRANDLRAQLLRIRECAIKSNLTSNLTFGRP